MSAYPSLTSQAETGAILATSPLISRSGYDAAPAWWTSASILVADLFALSGVYWVAVLVRRLVTPGNMSLYLQIFPGISLFVVAFAIHGLYPGVLLHPAEEIRRVFQCVSIVFCLLLFTTFLRHDAQSFSRSIVMATWALGAPAVLLVRTFARQKLSRFSWWGIPAVIFGSGASAGRVLNLLTNRELGIRVTAVIAGDSFYLPAKRTAHYAILAEPPAKVSLHRVIQDQCTGYRHVLLVPNIHGICSLGISAREIGGEIGFEVPQRLFHSGTAIIKRMIDLLLTLPGMIALLPMALAIAVAIKLTSRGPVFYGHTRLGRHGKTFKALKFRTMYENSESLLQAQFQKYPEQLDAWQRDQKLKLDPRVTRVGSWLRRYSLDELPQLCNVLLGQMSLVGPRPIVSREVLKYGCSYDLYSRVRPGITGLWQVSGRNDTTYAERIAFDEYYVRNWSIWLDSYILARTAKAVLFANGAY
jgi:Undecaprenyl-phosphate galactose phosphotransferase WbaP